MQNKEIQLRPLLTKDEDFIQSLFNEEEVYGSGFLTLFYPMSDLQVKSFLNTSLSNPFEKNFVITKDDKSIGFSQISNIDYINQKGELGVLLSPEYQNKGLGNVVFTFLISLCFNQLNMNKIECEIISNNLRSESVFKNLGFQEEGNLRESIFRDGNYYNKKIFGITRACWQKKSK